MKIIEKILGSPWEDETDWLEFHMKDPVKWGFAQKHNRSALIALCQLHGRVRVEWDDCRVGKFDYLGTPFDGETDESMKAFFATLEIKFRRRASLRYRLARSWNKMLDGMKARRK